MIHPLNNTNIVDTINTIIFNIATLAPVGVEKTYDIKSPDIKQTAEITTDSTTTALKLLQTLIADNVGKIIILDISNAPIVLRPKTIINAVSNDNKALYLFTLIPVALA